MQGRIISGKGIRLKKRRPESHKGENGKVLVVGGSMEYAGAIILAGMSAFRAGADLVVVAAPEKIAAAINCWPDFITTKFRGGYFRQEDAARIACMSKGYDVLLIGNGLGKRETTKRFAKEAIKRSACKKVIDADAIKAVRLQDCKNSIITPHSKEFEILLKNSGIKTGSEGKNIEAAREIIGDNVILLKGRTDAIFSGEKLALNRTGNPGMTKGGTGDVLAGLCAGLAAQGNPLFESACAAAYINGYAGDLLYREYGYGFTATDLADKIAYVMRRWQ
ncbi:NAD(P)H-hydrate dehydratase [Candidatus Woesearchaeota archaeon]|nr:NAD(P)H-hydrate dehydratase [Candidatus Woesearchaeota archaeon]